MDIASLYDIYKAYPSVQTDTRKIKQGDLFFALKGPNFNGNTFAAQALESGAAYAVVDEAAYVVNDKYLMVADVLTCLQDLARFHREQFSIPFIAITGSNGKTTTKELITAVLSSQYKTYATEGNLNNHIGVPLTLLKIKEDAEMAIIEMGANHLKEIESYCKIALPTHGIITNCGKAHIEGFGGIEGVRKGKGELYDFLRAHNGTIFRNADLDYLEGMASGIATQITYGSNNAGYTGQPVMQGVFLNVQMQQPPHTDLIHSHLVGDYNFPNLMVAIAVGLHFGISIDKIRRAIDAYQPDNSRSQWLKKGSNSIILDAYNANPTSMQAAISNFAKADLANKILWIGAMKEMGDASLAEHEALVKLINSHQWQDVILVGKEFEPVKGSLPYFDTSAEAAAYIAGKQPANASILIKGSRGSKMELLLDALEN